MARIVVDPVTRIEGHLRIEAQVEGGMIADAWSSGTMFRGIELILRGRDPREAWIWAQRICGVCTMVHALASVNAVEDALGIEVPDNARLVRNIIAATQTVQDHVIHFYHLHALDWVDVVSALKADPAKTSQLAQSISDWPLSSEKYFKGVQDRVSALVASKQLSLFGAGYWGHPAYHLPPEANLMAVAHYLEALQFQKEFIRIHAVLGGKNPHLQTFLVGGMATSLDPNEPGATVNPERIDFLLESGQVAADVCGSGIHSRRSRGGRLLSRLVRTRRGPWEFHVLRRLSAREHQGSRELLSSARHHPESRSVEGLSGRSGECHGVCDPFLVRVFRRRSDSRSTRSTERPIRSTRDRSLPTNSSNVDQKYSWLKAPRYQDKPMEVGPLARLLVAYASGQQDVKALVDATLAKLKAPPTALFSTLGRIAARALETQLLADRLVGWIQQLGNNMATGNVRIHNGEKWDPNSWPKTARGFGFFEAPRGSLGHWVEIEDQAIKNYQAVVPSTWNAGPRDAHGQRGAYEAALIKTPVADPDRPLELLRTIHSFDPCLACAVHVVDARGHVYARAEA